MHHHTHQMGKVKECDKTLCSGGRGEKALAFMAHGWGYWFLNQERSIQ